MKPKWFTMTSSVKFYLALVLLILFSLVIRIYVIRNNQFYFTMDQGRDAVYVRGILAGHWQFQGPAASIEGIYTGPLWYYLLVPFYLATDGHPIAGPLLLISINLAMAIWLAVVLSRQVGKVKSLLITSILLVSPSFLETSLYGFNPFLLLAICLGVVMALSGVSEKKQWWYLLASAFVGLSFHAEIAFAFPLTFAWLIISLILLIKKTVKVNYFSLGWLVVGVLLMPFFISELQTNFSAWRAGLNAWQNSEIGVAVAASERLSHFLSTSKTHLDLVSKSLIPIYLNNFSLVFMSLFIILIYWYIRNKYRSLPFISRFIFYSSLIFLFSLIWFSLSTGLNDWHLVGLPPLIVISVGLMLASLPRKVAIVGLCLLLWFQLIGSGKRLNNFLAEQDDQSWLKNELAAIDWVYQQADSKEFESYQYLPSIKDYPYQYLFYWYGKKNYGYLPCKYGVDRSGASSYVPQVKNYLEPCKLNPELMFLIIEPAVHQELQDQWKTYVAKNTLLLDSTQIGRIVVEKRVSSSGK